MSLGAQQPVFAIYLAGPIDDIGIDAAAGWRQDLIAQAPAGVLYFNPLTAYGNVNQLTIRAADTINRLAIRQCSGLVANLAAEGRAFGTIREIEFARMLGLPVAVADGGEMVESLLAYDILLERTPEEAVSALCQLVLEELEQRRSLPFPFRMFEPPEDHDG